MSSATTCHNTHGKTVLSFFSATVSAVLLVTTATLNAFILLVFVRNKSLWQKSMFYKLLLNITVADFLTGVIADPVSIMFHTKEGFGNYMTKEEVILVHYTLFSFNGVSILTMSLLCIDRIVALLKPLKYRNGLEDWKCYLMISSTWILGNLLVIPYFKIGYIKYLAIFSYFTVTFAALSLLLVTMVYKKYFTSFNKTVRPHDCNEFKRNTETDENVVHEHTNDSNNKEDGDINECKLKPTKSNNKTHKMSSSEKRVNKSFITLLVVFVLTYLPSVVMTTYMNLCQDCDCMFIHVLRDLTLVSIYSSALWRPLNFVIRLKTIRKEISTLLNCSS
ncbi:cholecystokinin receptor-like [Hydractinia symbiolongicarpus]|uniref:cholecystokinin receptor-like n=1 Tax=Hydractinia symbiolongicarpus TaxID=13093 RepID=UPI00254C44F6|nr:cholecystokinin receptor-like [Hydractinia symbiolongicarpus]